MIKLKMFEDVRVTYEYDLELTDVYVENLNKYLQERFKPVNAEKIPYFDAELLAGIYEEADYEEAKQALNEKLIAKGREPYTDIQVMSKEEYFTGCEECVYSLYDIVEDILNEDIWDCQSEEVDFDSLGGWKDIDREEEN